MPPAPAARPVPRDVAMTDRLVLEIAGEQVELLAGRALHWPARSRLLIADLHLGKADAFRRGGIALPTGGTGHDLERLDELLAATAARSLWILGDVLHGPSDTTHWRRGWDAWRARHGRLEIAALAGNHDRALASAGLELQLLGDAVVDGPFELRHAPAAGRAHHVVCGHLHPRLALPGLPGRWPGFWLQRATTVLPAFSRFTGGPGVERRAGDRFAVCAGSEIVLLSPHA